MSVQAPAIVSVNRETASSMRPGAELFFISLLLLFLELACIRWFPAHVLYLTFFTNTVLLACFLGMSVGCLNASEPRNFLSWTPALLAAALAAAHMVERLRSRLDIDVGNNWISPQLVFFGTEYSGNDVARFLIPIEVLEWFFFLVIALAMVGPGQELGRALNRLPNRVQAYTLNILGSVAGVVLFAACSWWQLTPFWWFLPVVLGLGYLLLIRKLMRRPIASLTVFVPLVAVLGVAALTSGPYTQRGGIQGEHLWSPYYRIDYDYPPFRVITVNLIGHQQAVSRNDKRSAGLAYALPHLLNRDSGGRAFDDVLIIGAGTGNDVSRALQWGARHIDAVEIDPVILELGKKDHPDHPYQDDRVTVHLDDGRNFLRSTGQKYNLIVYALVDSLVLHSSYSNIRLESYLFTRQAFDDVRRHLKPDGLFIVYNFFRQGWIVGRLTKGLEEVFGADPLVMTLPYHAVVEPDTNWGFTMFLAGDIERVRSAFAQRRGYWLRKGLAPGPSSPDGFEQRPAPEEQNGWERFGLAKVFRSSSLRTATDDWPFLYLRQPMIPDLSKRGMAIMGGLAILLLTLLRPKRPAQGKLSAFDGLMFFLGAGFMLVETKAVVHMALLFGSTWMVNTIVFVAVLVMILTANLLVLALKPRRLGPYYVGLLGTLALNCLIPLDFFLGIQRTLQVASSCLLVFAPIFFAGVIFAVSFGRSAGADRGFGANIAGAMFGGLTEYSSMLLGFQYLLLVAVVFYALSGVMYRLSNHRNIALI